MVSNVQEAIALIDKLQLNKTNIYTNNMSDVKVLLSKLKEIFTEETPMSFEEAKLADGLTIIKWEGPLAEGTSVMVVSESGEVPAPDGEHELQDGRKITVENGKVISLEVPEVMPTEEEPSVEVEIEAEQKMAEDYMPMIEELAAKVMKMEEMMAALEAKISEKMGATEEKMNTQKDAFSKLVEIVEKLADAPSEVVEAKPFNVNFQAEKDNQYNKLNEILNFLNK
jgi:translation initiation factor 1 (eIF-1/SUI1)